MYSETEHFTTYCDKCYDRHHYKLVLKDGRAVKFEDYATAAYYWYQWKEEADTLEVLDITSGKGF